MHVESLAIRKDAFSQESTSQNSCGVPVREKFSRFFVGISKLTYCYVNGLLNKGDTTKNTPISLKRTQKRKSPQGKEK